MHPWQPPQLLPRDEKPSSLSSTASSALRLGAVCLSAGRPGQPGQAWASLCGLRSHLVSGHLCAAALPWQGHDEDGISRELRREGHALPILACVRRVQQDGGLAADPALLPVEGDGVEAVVEACPYSTERQSIRIIALSGASFKIASLLDPARSANLWQSHSHLPHAIPSPLQQIRLRYTVDHHHVPQVLKTTRFQLMLQCWVLEHATRS